MFKEIKLHLSIRGTEAWIHYKHHDTAGLWHTSMFCPIEYINQLSHTLNHMLCCCSRERVNKGEVAKCLEVSSVCERETLWERQTQNSWMRNIICRMLEYEKKWIYLVFFLNLSPSLSYSATSHYHSAFLEHLAECLWSHPLSAPGLNSNRECAGVSKDFFCELLPKRNWDQKRALSGDTLGLSVDLREVGEWWAEEVRWV